jgi:hypothetical protein
MPYPGYGCTVSILLVLGNCVNGHLRRNKTVAMQNKFGDFRNTGAVSETAERSLLSHGIV